MDIYNYSYNSIVHLSYNSIFIYSASPLDPIPLSLLHEIIESLTIPLNNICCESLKSGTFPTSYKHAIITPLLKKPNLDPQRLNQYRPISNLSIFSKTLEQIVAKQLTYYLISHKIPHIFQSAYLPSKSTETALAKISSDILTNLDNKNGTILALLDISSAFDTINHTILIYHIKYIGITGTVHKWIPIHNQPIFLSFSSLNPFIFPSCNTRCSHWTNTL